MKYSNEEISIDGVTSRDSKIMWVKQKKIPKDPYV
jgi:hypothetical protein